MNFSHSPEIFYTLDSFKNWRSTIKQAIGFVPTMGNLHLGHLTLVEAALEKFPLVVVSIFVNPTQFGPKEDFDKYPRTLKDDCQLLAGLEKKFPQRKILIFAPQKPEEIYNTNYSFSVHPGPWGNILEGKFRPGHFQGVCTVVTILLHLVNPQGLFLGKKDYQQLKILQKMLHDLQFAITLYPVDTVRNPLGLALSSRNSFLSEQQLQLALQLSRSLQEIKTQLTHSWYNQHRWHLEQAKKIISTYCESTQLEWDYCELRQQDFHEISEDSLSVVLLAVVKINHIRLLDNLEFNFVRNTIL